MKQTDFRMLSAAFMLLSGVGLAVAGFCVDPTGHISESVLWCMAQCLIYAGSAVGIDIAIDHRINTKFTDKEKRQ